MNTSTISEAQEQAKAGVFEIAEKLKDFSQGCKDAYRDAERGARRMKIAAQDRIDEARQQIKSRPIAAAVVIASGALIAGAIIGLFSARNAYK